jgi:8-oxo-dGTP pyrophosphatase MutT (NUDIX family)
MTMTIGNMAVVHADSVLQALLRELLEEAGYAVHSWPVTRDLWSAAGGAAGAQCLTVHRGSGHAPSRSMSVAVEAIGVLTAARSAQHALHPDAAGPNSMVGVG